MYVYKKTVFDWSVCLQLRIRIRSYLWREHKGSVIPSLLTPFGSFWFNTKSDVACQACLIPLTWVPWCDSCSSWMNISTLLKEEIPSLLAVLYNQIGEFIFVNFTLLLNKVFVHLLVFLVWVICWVVKLVFIICHSCGRKEVKLDHSRSTGNFKTFRNVLYFC